ncbi:MAG: hypothetical protein ACOY0R_19840 [Chloroflexota bacterium]
MVENVKVDIKGNVSGQVAVGSYILQIGNVNGGVVNVAAPSSAARYVRRPAPVSLRPRPFQALLDRETEFATVREALQSSAPVSLFGDGGIGKTSFLRQLAHLPEIAQFADGVVFLDVTDLRLDDLLQSLFDAFYDSPPSFKPTEAEIRLGLQNLRALIILDDLELARDEVTTLLDAAPQCQFVLASPQRNLWGEGKLVPLGGLPEAEALALFERESGRTFGDGERDQVKALCVLMGGHPLRILQAAALVRERNLAVANLLNQAQAQHPEQAIANSALNTLTETQRRILAILAASDGAVISLDHLLALTSDPEVQAAARGLMNLGLVQAHSPRYSLRGDLVLTLATSWNLASWEDTLINYFVNWVAQQPSQMLMEESAEALIRAVKKAEEKKKWPEVIRIGRALEKTYALWKRWQSWSEILNILLKAARALGDKHIEGWVLHQLGSRAMCLGLAEQGKALLSQALDIRRLIGDKAGLAVTQHNLNVLMGIPLPVQGGQSGCRRFFNCGCGAAIAAALAVVVLVVIGFWLYPDAPPVTPAPFIESDTPAFTAAFTDTPAAVFTDPPLPTQSLTLAPAMTPTAPPVILFDFVDSANEAFWREYYATYEGGQTFGYDNNGSLKFLMEPYAPSPIDFVFENFSSYAGWEQSPELSSGQVDHRVILAYPYCGESGCFNRKMGGYYDLSMFILREGDTLAFQTGFHYPPALESNEDGVTFRLLFSEGELQDAIVIGEWPQVNDGTLQDWEVFIPPGLFGKSGIFLLEVDAGGNSSNDYSVWVRAQLIRP